MQFIYLDWWIKLFPANFSVKHNSKSANLLIFCIAYLKKFLDSNPGLESSCMELAYSLCTCFGSLQVLRLPPHSKNMTVRLIVCARLCVLSVSILPCDGPATCPECTPPLVWWPLKVGARAEIRKTMDVSLCKYQCWDKLSMPRQFPL